MNHDTSFLVFLSHNSADKPAVEELRRRLQACVPPVTCWFDKDDLRAQGTWVKQIEEVIEKCEAAAVFYGPNGLGKVHEIERQLLIERATRQPDTFRLIPVLLPGASSSDVTGFTKLHNWVDFNAGLDSPAAFERLVAFLRGEAPKSTTVDDELSPDLEPYRGLERFDGEHAGFFFGRDNEIRELCGRLKSWPFVAVIGGSGSGKSSLVRAGLHTSVAFEEFPRLKDAVRITIMPGANPLRALADKVAATLPAVDVQTPESLADALEARFRDRPDGLVTLLTSRFPDDATFILLVVDQFEELFTHCRDTTEAPGPCREQTEQFVRLLKAVAWSGSDRLRVAVTLRADFLDKCLKVAPLVALIQDRQLLLGDLTPDALRDVIVRPAQQTGAYFEKGLAARIVGDVEDEHGSLPLLQQALKELWALRQGRWLTNDGYEKTGGVAGALRKRADETLKTLNPAQVEIARNIFLRLTTFGEGVGDTRRRARLDELYPDGVHRAAVDTVIDHLRAKDSRLIVTNDDGTVEVTHEALIRRWDQLKTWLDADRDDLRLHRRLTDAAHEWSETCSDDPSRRDPAYLWDGGRLSLAESFHTEHPGSLSALEHTFLDTSVDARRRREEARQRTRAWFSRVVVAVSLVLAGLLYFANRGWNEADRQRRGAKAEQDRAERAAYIRTVELALNERQAKNLRRAGELLEACPPGRRGWEWRFAQRLCEPELLSVAADRAETLAFSPDGQLLAVAGAGDDSKRTGRVRVYDVRTGRLEHDVAGHAGPVVKLAFSGDDTRLYSAGAGEVRSWSLSGGREPSSLNVPFNVVTFSPDAALLAFTHRQGDEKEAKDDPAVRVWSLPDGSEVASFRGHDQKPVCLAFSADGRQVISADFGKAFVWSAATGERTSNFAVDLPVNDEANGCLAFSPDGTRLIIGVEPEALVLKTTMGERTMRSLSYGRAEAGLGVFTPDGKPVFYLDQVADLRRYAVFRPDGRHIAAAGRSGDLTIRDAYNGRALATINGHASRVVRIAYSPDATRLASLDEDGVAKIWSTLVDPEVVTLEPTGNNAGLDLLAISPDGRRVASAKSDDIRQLMVPKRVRLWDGWTGLELDKLGVSNDDVENDITSFDFALGGGLLAVGYRDGKIVLYDAVAGKPARTWKGHDAIVRSLRFDGVGRLVSASFEFPHGNDGRLPPGAVSRWDAATGRKERDFLGLRGAFSEVCFSPDGRRVAGAREKTVTVLDLEAVRPLPPFAGHDATVKAITFSPDGRAVASGDESGRVLYWDTSRGRLLATFRGHNGPVEAIAFSPDGLRLASGSAEIRLWDSATGDETLALRAESNVARLAFSPDGRFLAAGLESGQIRVWDGGKLTPAIQHAHTQALQDAAADWHSREALDALQAKHPFSIIFHLGRAIEARPKDPALIKNRAQTYALLADWDAAAADCERLIRLQPEVLANWLTYSWVSLARRDLATYRKICDWTLSNIEEAPDAEVSYNIVTICIMIPDAVADYTKVLALARSAADAKPPSDRYKFVLGAALYRSGQFEPAATVLKEAIDTAGHNYPLSAWFFLAMCQQRLGHQDEANRWLRTAQDFMRASGADSPNEKLKVRASWDVLLRSRILRREAEEVVNPAEK